MLRIWTIYLTIPLCVATGELSGIAAEEPAMHTDNFAAGEIGELPPSWLDLGELANPPQAGGSVIRAMSGPGGRLSTGVEIQSSVGTTQGIYRRIQQQTIYRAEILVSVAQTSQNYPLEFGFAEFSQETLPHHWALATVFSTGDGNPWWDYAGGPGGAGAVQDRVSRTETLIVGRTWTLLTYEVDTVTGRSTTEMRHWETREVIARSTFRHPNLIGRSFDTFYIANHSLGSNGGQSVVRICDVSWTDPGEDAVPRASFGIEWMDDGVLPAELVLDATASTPGESRTIMEYRWEIVSGGELLRTIANASADVVEIEIESAGSFTVVLTVTNDAGFCSSVSRTIEIPPNCADFGDTWACDDFEGDEIGAFPANWDNLGAVPVDHGNQLTRVVEVVDHLGSLTQAVEITSRAEVVQGIYKSLPERTRYTIYADVLLDRDMDGVFDNIPIDIGFGRFDASRSVYDWMVSSTFAGGPSLAWWTFSKRSAAADGQLDRIRQVPAVHIGHWYRVAYSIDTKTGLCSTRVLDLSSGGTETAHAIFYVPQMVGFSFDTVYIASSQMGNGNAANTARILVDKISFADVSVETSENFKRGDSNSDSNVDLSDAVFTLNWLFLGGSIPGCLKAANANGDGGVDIADPTYLLNYLFLGGPAPPEPWQICGASQRDEGDLTCDQGACSIFRPL